MHVFSLLPLQEPHPTHAAASPLRPPPLTPPCRLRTVELVCRHFHELSCNAPQLHLQAVVLPAHHYAALARIRSLAQWLVRRGGAVERLELTLSIALRRGDEEEDEEWDGLDPDADAR